MNSLPEPTYEGRQVISTSEAVATPEGHLRGSLRAHWYDTGFFSARTCTDALEDGRDQFASMPIVYLEGDAERSSTVGDIAMKAHLLAGALQHMGIGTGDAVAVQLTNRLECAVAYQAVLLCGAVLVPIVHIYGVSEVSFILAESQAKVFITATRIGSADVLERLPHYSRLGTVENVIVVDAERRCDYLAWSEILSSDATYERPNVTSDEVCLLLYTSGTTSAPKGVQHSHNTILAELSTMRHFLAGAPDDVSLVVFPPGHIAGVSSTLRPMVTGSRSVFMDRWDPLRAAQAIHRFRVTSTSGAPVHL